MFSKIIDISAVVSKIQDNSVIAISGFNMALTPEYLIDGLFENYIKYDHPKNVFIISDALPAIPQRGLDKIAEKLYNDPSQKFLRGTLMPFLGFSPWLQKMILEDRIEYYGWPIGITSYWFREIASGRPGLITKIGIDTFLDPRQEGSALNNLGERNETCKINLIEVGGVDCLLYQAPEPDFALVRATTSDEDGNLSMEEEGIRGSVLSIVQATKSHPKQGQVIAQVKWITQTGTIRPRDVDVPGPLVDHVVIASTQNHWQSGTIEYDPRISYEIIPPVNDLIFKGLSPIVIQDYEKIIARRVVLELLEIFEKKQNPVLVNLGIGIPAFVSSVMMEEEITKFIISILESGQWGGIALSGTDFGLAISPFALSTMPDMFSNFEGGIIDAASLGFLQIDKIGNVNPSILPDKIFGPGGFPVIAGGAPRTYFAGSFTAGKNNISVSNNKLQIQDDGKIIKFVESVYKVVFSGNQAVKYGHIIRYITERAVFKLDADGIILEEIAPGVDLDKDILSKMEFAPRVGQLKEMDARLFGENKMNVKEEFIQKYRR
ncbi:MAG: acyl CoA:acetate/3-ketoacid CoA transferase [Nitrososphaeraceae archaeon]|nr:acyl CoA:acetate/3-ketoacid CoA transferase [Nitrososphaeraceae archaeon]